MNLKWALKWDKKTSLNLLCRIIRFFHGNHLRGLIYLASASGVFSIVGSSFASITSTPLQSFCCLMASTACPSNTMSVFNSIKDLKEVNYACPWFEVRRSWGFEVGWHLRLTLWWNAVLCTRLCRGRSWDTWLLRWLHLGAQVLSVFDEVTYIHCLIV